MVTITTERLPDSLVSLEIEVEPERVEKSVERAVKKISQQVKIKGFRPGKAPRKAVEAFVGEEIANKVLKYVHGSREDIMDSTLCQKS